MRDYVLHRFSLRLLVLCLSVIGMLTGMLTSCRPSAPEQEQVSAARATDAVAAAILAHRATYAGLVERLGKAGVLPADEDYERATPTLPLPAQFLRLASEHVARSPLGDDVSFALVSDFPINRVNRPRSTFEKEGLQSLSDDPETPVRGVHEVAGRRYFSSMYADRAVTRACIECHNGHPDSPRKDFRLGDVMGALIISMALDNDDEQP